MIMYGFSSISILSPEARFGAQYFTTLRKAMMISGPHILTLYGGTDNAVEAPLPSPQLAHVLASDAAGSDSHGLGPNPWRRLLEPSKQGGRDGSPVTRTMAVESRRLPEKWGSFQDSCPNEDRLDLSRDEPTIHGIMYTVRYMNLAWKKKRQSHIIARTLQPFRRFCDTLDTHNNLIKILPEGSEYSWIFMGSLNAIIRLHGSDDGGSRQSRPDSFNQDLGQKSQVDAKRIGSVAQRIHLRAGGCLRAEIRAMREDIKRDHQRLGLQGEARRREEEADREERRAQELRRKSTQTSAPIGSS
ncbi:hypothetical protein GGTG_10730 [Gaeumannomyces tritici R3-111a-1]|uniref:Uncharacterized protein n=1 Tax=Gaeumannomyces tritici (strain R3-111a-1) TaxID=644352 RepID=J3PB57_GAET3|nr:hypothetical protein GGTG_10730 [Gaeumannomyces tritici R3-111a-1]EJT71473.1 hypothetical protein GGTG_10730 [Gaeumannomyces tritici R3-111a-1]